MRSKGKKNTSEEYAKDEDEFSCLSISVFLSVLLKALFVYHFGVCNSPRSYRQPDDNGQLLSRRYCTHSRRLFLCA